MEKDGPQRGEFLSFSLSQLLRWSLQRKQIFRGWLNSFLRIASTRFSHHAAHQGRPPPRASHSCRLGCSRRRRYFPLSSFALNTSLTPHSALDVEAKIRRDQGLMNRGLDTPSVGLEKRACEKNGCKCVKNTPQGAYCGLCKAVTESGKGAFYTRDIFECSPSGACCSYGSATICKGSNYASACPN